MSSGTVQTEWRSSRWGTKILAWAFVPLILSPIIFLLAVAVNPTGTTAFNLTLAAFIAFSGMATVRGILEAGTVYRHLSKDNTHLYGVGVLVAFVVFLSSLSSDWILNSSIGVSTSILGNTKYLITTLTATSALSFLGTVACAIKDKTETGKLDFGSTLASLVATLFTVLLALAFVFLDNKVNNIASTIDLWPHVNECESFPKNHRGKYIGDQRALIATKSGIRVIPCDYNNKTLSDKLTSLYDGGF